MRTEKKTDISSTHTIAILAGNGDLPRALVQALQEKATPYHLIAFHGLTDEAVISSYPHTYVGIGEVGAILKILHEENVTHVVMAGSLRRPSFSEIKVDSTGAKWLARLGLSMFSGDDTLLKKLIAMLEDEGFSVLSPHDILDDMIIGEGVHTTTLPSQEALQDIARGVAVLKALDTQDVGQAVVVQQGLVLGIEAIEGTAALLERVAHYKRDGFGGVLVKLAKMTQTHKADLPTIGLETVAQAQKAGLAGIAVGAHTTQVLAKDSVIDALNKAGMFLVALSSNEIDKLMRTHEKE